MSSALYDPVGGGNVVSGGTGPIQGNPEPYILIGSGGYLTTGDLQQGDILDMGGLAEFTFELWFLCDAYPGGTNAIARGPVATLGPTSYQWILSLTTTGALVLAVVDQAASTYTATSIAGVIKINQWHHVIAQARGGNLYIIVNNVQVATVGFGGTTVHLMPLLVNNQDFRIVSAGVSSVFSDIALYRTGLTPTRINAHYVAGLQRGFNTQLSGARIRDVLETVSSTAPRNIGIGQRQIVPRYMVGQSALDEVRAARSADAVDALFFAARDGVLVFLDAAHRSSSSYNTVQATFDDDGTDLPYADIADVTLSESFLINEWNVTATGTDKKPAATHSVIDAASAYRYFKRPRSISGVPVTNDTDSLVIATAMLAKYKDPLTRITSITMTTDLPDVTEAIFRRDIGDRIRILRTPPGGGARIDQTSFIQKITVDAKPGFPWVVTWGVSPL